MSLLCHQDEYVGDDICFGQRHRFWTGMYVWDNSLTSVGCPTVSEFSVASPPAHPRKTSHPPGCSSKNVVKSYSSWCRITQVVLWLCFRIFSRGKHFTALYEHLATLVCSEPPRPCRYQSISRSSAHDIPHMPWPLTGGLILFFWS